MDVSFKMRYAYSSNGGATVSPKPVPINCIILRLPLLFICGDVLKKKHSPSHIIKEKGSKRTGSVFVKERIFTYM